MFNRKAVLAGLMVVVMTMAAGCKSEAEIIQINENVADKNTAGTIIDEKHLPEFTDISFNVLESEMLEKEGETIEEYPSFYNGTVYRFADKSYYDYNGSIKYMTDDKGNIACIAWLYESNDSEDIDTAYEKIHEELIKKYGESGNASESMGTFGDLWYFDDVHVQISVVNTSDYRGMQVSYMKAEYSLKDTVDKKKQEKENDSL